jgi:hypothetical protein
MSQPSTIGWYVANVSGTINDGITMKRGNRSRAMENDQVMLRVCSGICSAMQGNSQGGMNRATQHITLYIPLSPRHLLRGGLRRIRDLSLLFDSGTQKAVFFCTRWISVYYSDLMKLFATFALTQSRDCRGCAC